MRSRFIRSALARKTLVGVAVGALIVLKLASGGSAAQQAPAAAQRGGAPATAAAAAYRAPRTADGKPNFGGVWQALNEANWNLEAHSAAPGPLSALGAAGAIPPGIGVVDGGPIPYKPEALEQRKKNFAGRLTLDPEIKCYLPGVPRANYQSFPFQIVQSDKVIMMVYEFGGGVRTINMEKPTPAPLDSWMGWSNGRWDGETLVVDSTGFNDKTWFDRSGNFHSDALHVVERYTARSADTLMYEVTIEDPQTFTRPWTMSMPLYRRVEKNAQILEFKCPEFTEDILYGEYRKQPSK